MLAREDIARNISEGAFWEALGLPRWASAITIDVRGEQLSDAEPELAGDISHITQVLTNLAKREIYEIALAFRDDVIEELRERFGPDFADMCPSYRESAWLRCQQLLRCDFKMAEVKMGPRGAMSMRRTGLAWALEMVQKDCIPVYQANRSRSSFSLIIGRNNCPKCHDWRWITCTACQGTGKQPAAEDAPGPLFLLEDSSLLGDYSALALEQAEVDCQVCQGRGESCCDCQDEFEFEIEPGTPAGSVLQGRGKNTGKTGLIILDRRVFTRRPLMQLNAFYRQQEVGQDNTLEEIQSQLPWGWIMLGLMLIGLGSLIGGLLGKLLLGFIIGALEMLGTIVFINYQWQRLQVGRRAFPAVFTGGLVVLMMAIGPVFGLLFGTWQVGLLIGIIIVVLLLAFFFLAMRR